MALKAQNPLPLHGQKTEHPVEKTRGHTSDEQSSPAEQQGKPVEYRMKQADTYGNADPEEEITEKFFHGKGENKRLPQQVWRPIAVPTFVVKVKP